MPALNVSGQILGRRDERTYRQYTLTGETTLDTGNTARPVAESYSRVRTTSNTADYQNPMRIGPLPVRSFSYEEKRHLLYDGASYHQYHTGVVSAGKGILMEHRVRLGTQAGYCPSLSTYYNTPTISSAGISAAESSSLDNEAKEALAIKVKDLKLNMGQVVAERTKTINTVVSTAGTLVKMIRKVRQGDIIGAMAEAGYRTQSRRDRRKIWRSFNRRGGAARTTAQKWLALQYGWMPLLQDVEGAATALAAALNTTCYGRESTRKKIVKQDHILIDVDRPNPNGPGRISESVVANTLYEIRYGVTFSTDPLTKWPAALGLTNPLTLAWELLPFSFVVDWFFSIGKALEALDAYVGCQFSDGYKTEFIRVTWTAEGSYTGPQGSSGTAVYSYGKSTVQWVRVRRSKLTAFPKPLPYPRFNDNFFNKRRLASALALLSVNFK